MVGSSVDMFDCWESVTAVFWSTGVMPDCWDSVLTKVVDSIVVSFDCSETLSTMGI